MKKIQLLCLGCMVVAAVGAANGVTVVAYDPDTGKPGLDICGNAAFSFNTTDPNITYYKGDIAPSDKKSQKDSSMTRAVAGEADITFVAKGKLRNGWIYGAKLALEAHKGATGIDKMYLIFERDNVGTFHAGNVKGPENTMLCGGQQLIGGTTGLDGAVSHDMDFATGLINPLCPLGNSSKATKLAYYSPKIYGFQFGVSITPDTKHVGHNDKDISSGDSCNGNDFGIYNKASTDSETPSGRSNIGMGLSHSYQVNKDVSTKVAVVCVCEDTQPINVTFFNGEVPDASSTQIKLKGLRSYGTTATVTYKNFSIGGGYINNGKGRMPVDAIYIINKGEDFVPGGFITTKDGNAGQAWNIGAKYVLNEKWEFSAVYHNMYRKVAKNEKVTGHATTLAVEYIICPGLKVFGEFDYIKSKSCESACRMYNIVHEKKRNAIKEQSTAMFVIGMSVSF